MQDNNDTTRDSGGRRDWLAALLLRRPEGLLTRFATGAARWRALPRNYRRRLQRRAAGAALVLAMAGSPLLVPSARAATITVDGATCTLIDAILSANSNAAVGGCIAGDSGVDTIDLQADVLLTASYIYYGGSDTGLPLVEEDLVIEGNGHIIERDGSAPAFRILATVNNVDLTINNTTISGGDAADDGGGVYVRDGALTITGSTISDNHSDQDGGGIYHYDGNLIITDSIISGNSALSGGGLYFKGDFVNPGLGDVSDDTALIEHSTFELNDAVHLGGGIYHDNGSMTIRDSTISENTADDDGAGLFQNEGPVFMERCFFTLNDADNAGGAVLAGGPLTVGYSTFYDNNGEMGGAIQIGGGGSFAIAHSTFSNNTADDWGGAINIRSNTSDSSYGDLANTIVHATITGNSANGIGGGGGIYVSDPFGAQYQPEAALVHSIVSGNVAFENGDDIYDTGGGLTADDYNVLSDDGKTTADAFQGFAPGGSDYDASSDANDLPLADILVTTLADNGGPTLTHALVSGSPAVDIAPNGGPYDQRGYVRPEGAGYDAGAYEYGAEPPGQVDVFMSTQSAGTTGDGLDFGPHDILQWDGVEWSKWFDGLAAGLQPNGKAKHNINAFFLEPDGAFTLISFTQNARTVPGIFGKVDGMDLVVWDGTQFILVFDGQDVGLTNKTQEKIDGVHLLPGSASPIGVGCQVYLLISTQGPGRVPNYNGGTLKFGGEDVLGFCVTANGDNTAGLWHMVLDGSAEGMPPNSTDSISFSDDGQTMYLTTRGTFNVDAASGGHSMVYRYDFGTGDFDGPHFIAADEGLPKKVDGLQVN